ncbi:MAG TPA: hypothetical protein VF151_10805 [Gemmatimonadales bacterium]
MPLKKSTSNAARSANIKTELNAGAPPAQAEAIAYSVQRRAQARQGKPQTPGPKKKKRRPN